MQFVSMYQKQPDIYPRAVKGWFATWRWTFVWLTQLLFYGLPWLQWGGRQAVLFDLEAQRFYILGPGAVSAGPDLPGRAARALGAGAVPLHRRGRPPVVRLHLPADGLHRDLHVGGAQDRRRPHRAHAPGPGAVGRRQARAQERQAGGLAGHRPVHRLQLRRLLHADPRTRGRPCPRWTCRRGTCSGSCSTAPPPTATRATCASRCASTCAPTRASRAR